jgi:hypothetical protein
MMIQHHKQDITPSHRGWSFIHRPYSTSSGSPPKLRHHRSPAYLAPDWEERTLSSVPRTSPRPGSHRVLCVVSDRKPKSVCLSCVVMKWDATERCKYRNGEQTLIVRLLAKLITPQWQTKITRRS